MTSFPLLDLAIGLSFVYLIVSLICTSANEALAGLLRSRAKFLDEGIKRLLNDDALKKSIYGHQLIRGLSRNPDKICPSYIPARNFALALMDTLTGDEDTKDPEALRAAVENHKNESLQKALRAVLDDSSPGLTTPQQKIEAWFNDGMDRVSGWYKRHSQVRVAVIAILVVVIANADSFKIVRMLWVNPSLRNAFVTAAEERLKKGRPDENLPMVQYPDPDNPTVTEPINLPERDVASDLEKDLLTQVSGWKDEFAEYNKKGLLSWLGWLLYSRLPGWLVNIRNAGKPPDQTKPGQTAVIAVSTGGTR